MDMKPSPGEPQRTTNVSQICLSIAAVLGALLIVGGLASSAVELDAGLVASLAGVTLLGAAALWTLAHASQERRQAIDVDPVDVSPEEAEFEDFKDAQWKLSDAAVRYRQLLDLQSDFIVRRARDGRLVFANSSFLDAFGLIGDDVIGSHYRPHALRTGGPADALTASARSLELLKTRRGKRWIAWEEAQVSSPHGDIEFQSVGRDVTVEREIEEALKEERDRAETANREKSRFLAAMSHEIRTPMNGIIGMITLLRDTRLDTEQKVYARVAEDSARALLGLLDGILDFSKVEAGRIEMANEIFSLRACIAQMMQLMAPEAEIKNLSLDCALADAVPEWVRGDEMRLRQIMLNLLSNAIKFTDDGGVAVRVDIAADRTPKSGRVRVAIKVADSGVGFSPQAARRLFDEFEQDAIGMSRHPGGTGLGLAISKRIAEAMSGDIVAATGEDNGAIFTALVELGVASAPADTQAALPSGARPDLASEVGTERPSSSYPVFNVLVAEDNQINALLACKIIERAGGRATVVEDGRAAIAAMWEALEERRPPFDLVLMDVLMPEVDGLMATKSIKALYRERNDPAVPCPPIIALTAKAFAEDRKLCRAAGMDDYLAKPFDARELHSLLIRWTATPVRAAPPAA